jgi:cyclohexyl-isocyanide hydratase
MVAEAAFGLEAAQLAEVTVEYDPHPPYGMGVPEKADPALVAKFTSFMQPLVDEYRKGSVGAFEAAGV